LQDRLFWIFISQFWRNWKDALIVVKPETVIKWHRKGFKLCWTWKIRKGRPGRPKISKEIRKLIKKNRGKSVRRILVKIHPADLAEILPLFSDSEQVYLFNLLDITFAGELLDASNESIQKTLISESNPYFIAAILDKLYTDEAADILSNLSVDNANRILGLMQSEEAREVKELMFYEPYTAGRVMEKTKTGKAQQVKEPGYALRFPRLTRFREDKRSEDATSLKEVAAMFAAQMKRASE